MKTETICFIIYLVLTVGLIWCAYDLEADTPKHTFAKVWNILLACWFIYQTYEAYKDLKNPKEK